jgi:hypothetical protein
MGAYLVGCHTQRLVQVDVARSDHNPTFPSSLLSQLLARQGEALPAARKADLRKVGNESEVCLR